MSHQPQGESIWGNINTCVEIALNIYMIATKDKNGVEHKSIVAHKDSVGNGLSKQAATMAKQDGEWLCFDENNQDIPMYEILQQRIAMCKKFEANALQQMAEIKQNGKLTLTDYFGECAPPMEDKSGSLVDLLKIRNGIFFTQDEKNPQFAIHESIANNYLTPAAAMFAERNGAYLFYNTTTAAVALNELKGLFDECDALIVSEDSLYATLHQQFCSYVEDYNSILPEESKIPEVNAPTCLFLQIQLEAAKEAQQLEISTPRSEEEPDFNEETDFEI